MVRSLQWQGRTILIYHHVYGIVAVSDKSYRQS